MNKKKLERFEQVLLAKRAKIMGNIDEGRGELDGLQGDASQADMNDDASTSVELSVLMTLNDSQKKELADISIAVDKVRVGTYGVCDGCGEAIGEKRMEAMPETPLCITCKGKEEQGMLTLNSDDGPMYTLHDNTPLVTDIDDE